MQIPLHFDKKTPESMLENAREFYQKMRMRRTVRMFSDEEVDIDIIRNAVKTAATAPSGANKQPWHFSCRKSPRCLQYFMRKYYYEHAQRPSLNAF